MFQVKCEDRELDLKTEGLTNVMASQPLSKFRMGKHLFEKSKLKKTCIRFELQEENLDGAVWEKVQMVITKFDSSIKKLSFLVTNKTQDVKTYVR